MAAAGTVPAKLDVGQVIQTTFAVIGRNFFAYALLSLLFAGLPTLAVTWLRLEMLHGEPGQTAESAFVTLVSALVGLVTTAILQGALVQMTVQDLNGGKASMVDGFATGLRNFLPLIGIGVLYGVGLGFGLVLLVVPGLILATMWVVAVPVRIVEGRGVSPSFTRSQILTKGNRWRILGLLVVWFVFAWAIQALLAVMSGGFSALMGESRGALIVLPISSTLSGMVRAAAGGVLYAELRRIRDGVGVSELAAVFD